MKRLTILIDMDDTIENLLSTWVEYLNKKHGLSQSVENITEWEITRAFPSLSANQIFEPLKIPEFWDEVRPLPYAVDTIEKLVNDGHDVFIVTASHPDTLKIKTERCLFKYFPFLSYKNVIVAHKKQMIVGDIMIDDAPFNLENGSYFGLLMDSPTNRKFKCDREKIFRVYSWHQIYDIICTICDE